MPSDADSQGAAVPGDGGIVVDPPAVPAVTTTTADPSSYSATTAESGDPETVFVASIREKFHAGPLPSADTLQDLARIYRGAPKIIFDDFQEQARHRREMERLVISTNCRVAIRGQNIGGGLGALGLIVSGTVAISGYSLSGFGIALASLTALVAVFIVGRRGQEEERRTKAQTQARIRKGEAVESIEDDRSTRPDAE